MTGLILLIRLIPKHEFRLRVEYRSKCTWIYLIAISTVRVSNRTALSSIVRRLNFVGTQISVGFHMWKPTQNTLWQPCLNLTSSNTMLSTVVRISDRSELGKTETWISIPFNESILIRVSNISEWLRFMDTFTRHEILTWPLKRLKSSQKWKVFFPSTKECSAFFCCLKDKAFLDYTFQRMRIFTQNYEQCDNQPHRANQPRSP